jgi:hypothetical protein
MLVKHAAAPLYQQILCVIFMPPIVTGIWWLMSRGLTTSLGTNDSQAVTGWTKSLRWFILIALYVVSIAFVLYGRFA